MVVGLQNPSTWIAGCLEHPVGPFALRPHYVGFSRLGADSGVWKFLKLELMRTGARAALEPTGRAQCGFLPSGDDLMFTLNHLCFCTSAKCSAWRWN